MNIGEAAAEQAASAQSVRVFAARFLGQSGELADLLGPAETRLTASKATADWPAVGADVWVIVAGSQRIMLGSPDPGPSRWGRVVSVGTGSAVVQFPPDTGESAAFALPRGLTPEPGELVLLEHAYGGLIVAAYASASAPPPAAEQGPTSPVETVRRTAEIHSAWDGTAQTSGFWIPGDKLYTLNSSGAPNYATIGYGDGVAKVVPAGARVLDAAVFVDVLAAGPAHTGGTHTLAGPSGVPAPARTFAVQPADGWLPVPAAAAQAIADGDATGLTFYGGSGRFGTVYASARRNPGFGRLRVRYEVEA